MLTDEERTLRDGLHALGAVPPPAPVERVRSSVRKARVIRLRQVTATLVAVAAVAVPAAAVVAPREETTVPAATSPATWPDRRNPALLAVSEEAFAEWDSMGDLGEGERVHWLYADEVPGANAIAVAFATCGPVDCSRLVLLTGFRELATRRLSRPPWTDVTRNLSPYGTFGPLSTLLSSDTDGDDAENVVFVLPPPETARVTYTSERRRPGTGGAGELTAIPNGAFVGYTGYLSASVTVTAFDRNGARLDMGTAGKNGDFSSIGEAPPIDHITAVAGYDIAMTVGRQVKAGSDLFTWPDPKVATYTLFVRCIGDERALVLTGDHAKNVPCDGTTHRVGPVQPVRRDLISGSISVADPYTVYSFGVAVPHP